MLLKLGTSHWPPETPYATGGYASGKKIVWGPSDRESRQPGSTARYDRPIVNFSNSVPSWRASGVVTSMWIMRS